MKDELRVERLQAAQTEETGPTLADVCVAFGVARDLVDNEADLETQLKRMLESLASGKRGTPEEEAGKLRILVDYIRKTAQREVRAEMSGELGQQAAELSGLQAELENALSKERQIRKRFEDVLDAIDAGVLIVSETGRIVSVNHAVADLTGQEAGELVGLPLERLLQELKSRIEAGDSTENEETVGTPLMVERRGFQTNESGEVVLLSGVDAFGDQIERQKRIEQLSELFDNFSKLCHAINNPLTTLMGRAQLLGMNKDLDPKLSRSHEIISEAAGRIAAQVSTLGLAVRDGRDDTLAPLLEQFDMPNGV